MIILAVIPKRLRCGVSDYASNLYPETSGKDGDFTIKRVPFSLWNCLKIPFARADVVHLQHEYSMFGFAGGWGFLLFCYLLILRVTGVRLAVTIHTVYDWNRVDQLFAHRTQSRLVLALLRTYGKAYHRVLLGAASRLIFMSEASRNAFLRVTPNADPGKLVSIAIGAYDVPIRAQNGRNLEQRYGIKPTDYVLTLFGFAYPNKGYHLTIEALRLLGDKANGIKLLVVSGEPTDGGANYLASLKETTAKSGLTHQVIFTGFIPFDDPILDEVLVRTDCFLYPYLRESATSGSLATTLAARKVYLTSDLEMFQSFTPGLKFRAGEPVDLAAKIVQAQQMNPSELAVYRERLESYIKENNIEATRKRHLENFSKLVR
jgi:glycosyltransferase involved in cell wall biosynthesis